VKVTIFQHWNPVLSH